MHAYTHAHQHQLCGNVRKSLAQRRLLFTLTPQWAALSLLSIAVIGYARIDRWAINVGDASGQMGTQLVLLFAVPLTCLRIIV